MGRHRVLDADGIVAPGEFVASGDFLVNKMTPLDTKNALPLGTTSLGEDQFRWALSCGLQEGPDHTCMCSSSFLAVLTSGVLQADAAGLEGPPGADGAGGQGAAHAQRRRAHRHQGARA